MEGGSTVSSIIAGANMHVKTVKKRTIGSMVVNHMR